MSADDDMADLAMKLTFNEEQIKILQAENKLLREHRLDDKTTKKRRKTQAMQLDDETVKKTKIGQDKSSRETKN